MSSECPRNRATDPTKEKAGPANETGTEKASAALHNDPAHYGKPQCAGRDAVADMVHHALTLRTFVAMRALRLVARVRLSKVERVTLAWAITGALDESELALVLAAREAGGLHHA